MQSYQPVSYDASLSRKYAGVVLKDGGFVQVGYDADGSFEYLRSRAGFVLAGMEGIRYRKQELQLEKGDTLYLYTDGVTEAANIENALFGEERLQNVLNENRDGSPEELLKAVTASLQDFVGETAQSDDITMLALQYKGDMLL